MDIIQGFNDVSSAIGITVGFIDSLLKRFGNARRNPAFVETLIDTFKRLENDFSYLQASREEISDNIARPETALIDSWCKNLFQSIQNGLDDLIRNSHALEERKKNSRSLVPGFRTANSLERMLSSLQERADEVRRDIMKITKFCHNLKASSSTLAACDVFRPSFDVEPNPPYVVLNFGSASHVDGDELQARTIEAKLKQAVMEYGTHERVAAVSFSTTGRVVTKGMGGVGKSCALRGLAKDEDVIKRFPAGVYMIVLGMSATNVSVIAGLQAMVRRSGGKRTAQSFKATEDIQEALDIASEWFRNRCILLLVDNVWESSGLGSNVLLTLQQKLVDGKHGSRLAFSTRDAALAPSDVIIKFTPRPEPESRNILLKAAGMDEEDAKDVKHLIDELLGRCGGLPLTLVIVGKAIAQSRLLKEVSWREACENYISIANQYPKTILKNNDNSYSDRNLEEAIQTSLKGLELGTSIAADLNLPMDLSKMYRSLAVQKRQTPLPVSVLKNLWETADVHGAQMIMDVYVYSSLAEYKQLLIDGQQVPGIVLHDMQLDFAENKCNEHGDYKDWHRKLLDSWMAEPRRQWTADRVFEDTYVRNNLARHLVNGECGGELRELVKHPEWTAKRLRKAELLALEEDFNLAIADALAADAVGVTMTPGGDEARGLRMIAKTARLSSSYVLRNPREVWFQLCGRLMDLAKESPVVAEFIDLVEECAEKPWAKPAQKCLSAPGGSVDTIVQCVGALTSIDAKGDDGIIRACGLSEGRAFVCAIADGRVEQETIVNDRMKEGRETEAQSASFDARDNSLQNPPPEGAADDFRACLSWSPVQCVCCTSDGGRIATAHADGSMKFYNTESGQIVSGRLPAHVSSVWCAQWSPKEDRVVTGTDDGKVIAWDFATGEAAIGEMVGHFGWVWCVAWSPDGTRIVSGGRDGTVRVWDAESGKSIYGELRGHDRLIRCVAWSPDGTRIVSGGRDGSVRIWNAKAGALIGGGSFKHSRGVECVSWSSDGKYVASGGHDGKIWIWNGENGESVGEGMSGHSSRVTCLAWHPAGKRIASGAYDGNVRMWDIERLAAIGDEMRGHNGRVQCISWSGNGDFFASGGDDGTVRRWVGERAEPTHGVLHDHRGRTECVSWSVVGRKSVACGRDGKMRMWDSETGEAKGVELPGHSGGMQRMTWAPNGEYVASCGRDRGVKMWHEEMREAAGEAVEGHRAICLVWSPDGERAASGGHNATVSVWCGKSGKNEMSLQGCGGRVVCLGWSPNGVRIASGADNGKVRLWDVERKEGIGEAMSSHTEGVACVSWSPDGSRFVSGAVDGTVQMWDGNNGEILGEISALHHDPVECLVWSPNGKRVVAGGRNGSVTIWNGETFEMVGSDRPQHSAQVVCVVWSSTSKRFVSGAADGSLRIWNGEQGTADGEELLSHSGRVRCAAWSADEKRISSGSSDGSVRVWNAESCDASPEWVGRGVSVKCVSWSEGDEQLRTVGDDGAVVIWTVEESQLVRGNEGDISAGRWIAHDATLELDDGERKVLATFEDMHFDEIHEGNSTSVMFFLENDWPYHLEIL